MKVVFVLPSSSVYFGWLGYEIHSWGTLTCKLKVCFDCMNARAGGVWTKDGWPPSDRKMKTAVSEKQVCRVCVCVGGGCICVCVWASELLGCIGILRGDWQGRSLLGEIVNSGGSAEPVICSRQPWKGTADSRGGYWGFLRRCLADLGPGPNHGEPGLFRNPRRSMHSDLLPPSLCLSAFLCCFMNHFWASDTF